MNEFEGENFLSENRIETTEGQVFYADKPKFVEGFGDVIVREIDFDNELKERFTDPERLYKFLNSREGVMVLRKLTNNRYPSYNTFSHVIGGGDQRPGVSRASLDSMGLDILKTEFNRGISVASPDNSRFGAGFTVPNTWFDTYGHYLPLFVFGTQSNGFRKFVEQKYQNLISKPVAQLVNEGAILKFSFNELKDEVKRANGLISSNDAENEKILNEKFVLGHLLNISDGESPKFIYSDGWYLKSATRNPRVELDFMIYHKLPVYSESGDGSHFSVNEKVYGFEELTQPSSLRWGDAELMIDWEGLGDGKKKVVFAQPDPHA